MKAVMMSIQPRWCELIASGKKTVEVRTTKPKLETPFKVYIYCTKDEPLYHSGEKFYMKEANEFGNGKVIGEFVCCNIDEYNPIEAHTGLIYWLDDRSFENTGLDNLEDLCEYGNGKRLYGWHISDLKLYDKPRALSEFHKDGYQEAKNNVFGWTAEEEKSWQIKRPPQSWMYVEVMA